MRIKTQFALCIVVFSVILVVIAASVTSTEEQVNQLHAQEAISSNIEQGASKLNSISIDYFLYQENLQISRWQTTVSSLSSDLSNLKPYNAEQQTLANSTTKDLQTLNSLFDELVVYLQNAPRNVSVRIDPAFQTRWSGLALQSQTLSSHASQLSHSLDAQAKQANETNNLLIVSLVSTFGALLATIYLIVFRRTLKSVSELQNGIRTIGSGNLSYVIKAKRNDEISELSRAFNQMTANLKTVTASKTDLEQTQASLRESEQRWATTLASIGDAVIATNTSGKIAFMNGEAEKLTGWALSEASQKPVKTIFNIINEQSRLEVESPIERVLREGIVVGLANHTVLIRKDGTEVPIDDSGAPIKDKDGKTTGVVLIFRDITERKKAEEAISESLEREHFLAEIVRNASIAVGVGYPDGRLGLVNAAFLELTGYSEEELQKINWNNILTPPEYVEFEKTKLEEIHRKKQYVRYEKEYIRKNGSRVPIELTVNPFFDKKGNVTHYFSFINDITERKKAEEALKENEQLYHTVFDNSQDGFQLIELVYDKNGKPIDHKFLKVNHAYEKIIGVKAEDILDKTAKYISPNQELHWLDVPDRVTKTGISEHVELYNKDIGKWLDCYYFLYSKNIVGTLFRDITERKKLEKQLQDSERLAAIGATAGMVGHDIRNPLQAITGDLYLARTELSALPENELKANAVESLNEIEKNIDYINKIVADLQDYARPLNPRAQETNIKSLFNEILAKNGIPKNIKVTVKVEDKAEKIMVDPDYLKRITANLTLNAVQAMPKGGKLTIHAYADKATSDVLITVKDTGVGIPENVKPKLFTPMMTTKSKGQGFGLAVVKRMTEGLGGTVTFESQEGKGTTFIIRLPPKS